MLLILLACRDMAFQSDGNGAEDGAGDDSGTVGPTNDAAKPTYWTLGASLEVEAGLPRASESSVSIERRDADSEILCSVEIPLTSVGSKPPPDDAIYAWWSLAFEPDDHCDAEVDTVLLGIGEMNDDVEAGMGSIGYDAAIASGCNGAYFGPDATTQWAFGIAGLEDCFAGGGDDIDGPPIPDGTWIVKPLYPFPI